MADIFISYAREDREWVEKLASQLVTEGFTVWWDWDLLVGKRYRETIETELQTAKAAIVIWSQHSIRSDFVRDEAEDAQQRNILLPLLKEIVRPPAGFRQLQTADLSGWHGGGEHIEFRRMMKGVSSLVGRPSAGDTGIIRVDPAHPTLHFEEEKPASPAPPVDVAPVLPTEPQAESPPVVVARAPEPEAVAPPVATVPEPPAPVVPPPASPPVQAAPAPPVQPTPVTAAAGPPATNPMLIIAAVGVVAVIAVIYLAVQFFGGSSTTPAKPPAPVIATPAPHPAPLGMRPDIRPPAPPTGIAPSPDGTGGDTGGDSGSGDVGQAGPHGSGTPVPAPTPPAPPAPTDEGGDSGGDVGQGH